MQVLSQKRRAGAWQAVFRLLDHLSTRRRRGRDRPDHLVTGSAGEQGAFFFLRRSGFTVVARDWRSGRAPGDLDLVGWEGDALCFVEVKTRSSRNVAAAEAAVDRHKRRNLRRLARHYLRQAPDGTLSRFDVLSVYIEPGQSPSRWGFELFRNAFGWKERM